MATQSKTCPLALGSRIDVVSVNGTSAVCADTDLLCVLGSIDGSFVRLMV